MEDITTNIKNEGYLKDKIQELLGKEITRFLLKGKGACNNAYYIETVDGSKYIIKEERIDKEFQPQNDLTIEAKVIEQLYMIGLSTQIPRVVFVSENPKMYGYEYIEGETMRGVWQSLSEEEKISICRALGCFHAEIGRKFTKDTAENTGIVINESSDVHPETLKDCKIILVNPNVPDEFKMLAREARAVFDTTMDKGIFQFIHNDSHHENILIKDKKISGVIDFGEVEYGEIAKEFSRYIRDFPDYFQHIISAYEKESGNKLSYERLVSNALLSGLNEIVENYLKGGDNKKEAENSIVTYRRLMSLNN
jgi:aminoglycoside phosphotransferase (APT) family kinase protein